MKRRKRWRKILISAIIIAFFSLFLGGWIYYYRYKFVGQFWICLGLTLQNCVESLLFSPILSIHELASDIEFWTEVLLPHKIVMILYGITMVLAPLIDVFIVFKILEEFLSLFIDFSVRKKRILIIGYNDMVKRVLDVPRKNSKIFLWTEDTLSAEEERNLFLIGVSTAMSELRLGLDEEKANQQVKRINRYLRRKRIENVVIMSESDTHNMQYYFALSSCKICKKKTIHFYVMNNRFETKTALQAAFDRELGKVLEEKTDSHMDLRVFCLPEIQAKILFHKMPLSMMNKDNQVHLVIVGGGRLAEYVLLHAMNQGVFTPDNRIRIDVLDKDTSYLYERLKNRFAKGYVTEKSGKDGFELLSDRIDGFFEVFLHNTDVYAADFSKTIEKINTVPGKNEETSIDYIVFGMEDADSNLYGFLEVAGQLKNSKIAIGIPSSKHMEKHIKEETHTISEVFLYGEDGRYIGIEDIVNTEEERNIRKYNRIYNKFAEKGLDADIEKLSKKKERIQSEREWNVMKSFQRQSNRALYYHKSTRMQSEDIYQEEMKSFLAEKPDTQGQDVKLIWSRHLIERNPNGEYNYGNLVRYAKTEHRRFCYFYASEGWTYSETKLPEKLEHDCLYTWEKLVENRENALVYDLISIEVDNKEKTV